jgi:hypothetical protein
VPGATLRRPADAEVPESASASRRMPRPSTLRIVLSRGPATTMAIARHPASVARVVRHGPPEAVAATSKVRHPSVEAVFARARSLWPGLDPRALTRTRGDVRRIARLVGRRTALPEDTIVAMLTAVR